MKPPLTGVRVVEFDNPLRRGKTMVLLDLNYVALTGLLSLSAHRGQPPIVEQANTLTSGAGRALARAIGEVLDRQPRVVLLAAEGPIFCAGGDIDEFVATGAARPAMADAQRDDQCLWLPAAWRYRCPVPRRRTS